VTQPARRNGPTARATLAVAALAVLAAPGGARAEGSLFVDPVDGAFDATAFLASRYGFVPLVAPITEPAVGYGAAAGLVFLHGKPAPDGAPDGERRVPPGISVAFGMATESGSWGAGGGHLGHWFGGNVRYLGGAAYTSLELEAFVGDQRVDFRIDALPLVQDLTFRLPGTDLFAGARYVLADTDVTIHGDPAAGVPPRDLSATLSGIGPVLRWDSRDTIFSPSAGTRVEASVSWMVPWLGSDLEFWRARVAQVSYAPLAPWLVSGLRLELQFSGGETPFWARPYVALRGVPALRYQGEHVAVIETEQRVDVTRRWSGVAFGGAGLASSPGQLQWAWNAGGGFRYLLARGFGLRTGIDVARGPEEWAFYVVAGNGWR
jgi:hypothetical protein